MTSRRISVDMWPHYEVTLSDDLCFLYYARQSTSTDIVPHIPATRPHITSVCIEYFIGNTLSTVH